MKKLFFDLTVKRKLVVPSVVALMAVALGLWWMSTPIDRDSKRTYTEMRILGVGLAVEEFYSDFNRYPSSQEGLLILRDGDEVYLRDSNFMDSWGNELIYQENANNDVPFSLYSKGPNGVDDGGFGDDISYWHIRCNKEVTDKGEKRWTSPPYRRCPDQ